jgi:methionyl-tRNA formyltransferase
MARLAFFGTPEIAATCLRAVADVCAKGEHQLVLAVCQPDKPVGRGHKLEAPPVKQVATSLGLPVLQPTTLRKDTPDGEAFYAAFVEANIDVAIVVAYGRLVPQRVLDVPKNTFVNVHASLLPRWRGAAPIQRAIEAGDVETGVCLMHMVKELDAGDVFAEARVAIAPDDTGETLAVKLAELGGHLLRDRLDALIAGQLPRVPQPAEGLTWAHMLKKEDGVVDFNRPAQAVVDRCRAFVPWPGSSTVVDDEVTKLFDPRAVDIDTSGVVPGTLVDVDRERGAVFACSDRGVAFGRLQRPNKGPMAAWQWAQGRPKSP